MDQKRSWRRRSRNGNDAIADIVRSLSENGRSEDIAKVVGQWRRTEIAIKTIAGVFAFFVLSFIPNVKMIPQALEDRFVTIAKPSLSQPAVNTAGDDSHFANRSAKLVRIGPSPVGRAAPHVYDNLPRILRQSKPKRKMRFRKTQSLPQVITAT